MPPESHATDDDIIRNQIALQLAQYDAASKAFGFAAGASDSESSNENQAQAKYVKLRSSEIPGIGAATPTNEDDEDDLRGRQETAATQRLRKQLLGDRVLPPAGAVSANGSMIRSGHSAASKPRPRPSAKREQSEDEEVGRAGVGKSKSQSKRTKIPEEVKDEDGDGNASRDVPPAPTHEQTQSKKRGTSYLDQVLAERANKKKKKNRKKNHTDAG